MLAREYIPENFRQLNMLRLFLPARGQYDGPQYWSTLLLEGEELTGSSDWNELYPHRPQERFDPASPRVATCQFGTRRSLRDLESRAKAVSDSFGCYHHAAALLTPSIRKSEHNADRLTGCEISSLSG